MLEMTGHIERYAVVDLAAGVVDKLELDMLAVASDELRRSEILDVAGAEHRLLVSGPERIEAVQHGEERRRYLAEGYDGVDLEQRLTLRRKYVFGHVFLEAARELGNVFLFERKPTA